MNELVYRPQHKSEQELKEDFVIRLVEFEKLMNSVKTDQSGKAPQHIILQGKRGMGKTTLMYRVYYQVQQDFQKKGLIPVIFSEEQYSVRSLYKLWEQIALFLEDNHSEYSGIWYEMQELQELEDYDDRCFELLKTTLKKNKNRLLLLIDNFGVMVDKFTKQEQQRLREILITFSGMKIIGGSAVILESFYKYDQPFFDFFKTIQLGPLNSKEVQTLLLRLGVKYKTDTVKEIAENQPGRIESMRILTGGVPRTIVLLFNIFLDSDQGNSIEDLKKLLDLVTPLYKHRMDELPPQQQEIVDKLALNWDGMSVSELSKKTRMESKAISAQLTGLVKSGVVNATKSTGKNKYYQLEERFFNIWYLMQHAPRSTQRKVIWLTRFLEYWCAGKMLEDTAKSFANRIRSQNVHPEYVLAMTYAYAQADGITIETRDELIKAVQSTFENEKSVVSKDLPPLYEELNKKIAQLIKTQKYHQAKSLIHQASLPTGTTQYLLGYVEHMAKKFKEATKHLLIATEKDHSGAMFGLAILYEYQFKDSGKAEKYYLMAINKGYPDAMFNLALLYENQLKDFGKAEKYYLMAIDKDHAGAMNNLGILYENQFKDLGKAEKYYLMAIDKDHPGAMNNLALLYENQLNDFEKAEKYYLMAIDKDHPEAMNNLALLYENQFKDLEKAEKYYLAAIEKDHAGAMNNLGILYENQFKGLGKAEKYYLAAIEKENLNAMANMLRLVISNNDTNYLDQAKIWVKDLLELTPKTKSSLLKVRYLLWINNIEEAISYLEQVWDEVLSEEDYDFELSDLLSFAVAKGLKQYVLKLFDQKEYQLKDRFKVLYYAIVTLLEKEHANEVKKMGKELEEPVKEMVEYILELEEKYQE